MDSRMNRASSIDYRDPGNSHDRVLIFEGQKFYVKSRYLAIWSAYFEAIFDSEENRNKVEIELKGVSAEDFNVFVNVLFTGPFLLQEYHLKTLLDLSNRFDADYVFKCCDMFVLTNFDKLDKVNLLKLACEYGIENWKKASMDLLVKKLDYLNVYQTTMAHDRNSDDMKKRVWKSNCDNVKSLEPIQLFELAVEHKLDDDFRNKIMHSIRINVENYNPIKMLKFAFKHDSEELKKKLSCFIYTSDRIELFYHCDKCTDGIQRIGCKHIAAQSKLITRNSFIAQYIDEILKMPEDMKNFVIVSSTRWN